MNLKNRVLQMERAALPSEPLRVVYVANSADRDAEYERQRQQERYYGPLAVLEEADRGL